MTIDPKGDAVQARKRKLIEVALPLETINREAAREKSIRHGHPSTLHLWWARRPLAAARAVLFAQLVDDPSSFPDQFPTEEAQRVERERLHGIIERLVVWENTRDRALLAEAHAEILTSTGGNPPPIVDPFAGGGTIPLEAQRLGLEAHASDLNPVAVLINKALIEFPPRFVNRPPIFPGVADGRIGDWEGARGLAADVRAYGAWVRDEADRRISAQYPKAILPDGTTATVIAWNWARTVTCPNPVCGIEMPLVRSWWLSKKKGGEAWIRTLILPSTDHPSGRRVDFEVAHGNAGAPTGDRDGTVGRGGATCAACGSSVALNYLRDEGQSGRMGARMIAIVASLNRTRVYLSPVVEHEGAADVRAPEDTPDGLLSTHPQYMGVPRYGFARFSDLFTNRQLLAITTFSDLVIDAREQVLRDAVTSGAPLGEPLESGGSGAQAYADAVASYIGLCASKMTIFHCGLARWRPDADKTAPAFGRGAIAMVWDFAEASPFAGAGGDWLGIVDGAAKTLEGLQPLVPGYASQVPAQDAEFVCGVAVSTDPPYYDNVPYADLSDFFYVWLRRSMRSIHPDLLSTMLVPKAEELVANTVRQGGKKGARDFFETGFRRVFERARETATAEYPLTVYYAFRQSDASDDGVASTGWETLLDGMIRAGWAITST
jgi:putative DNA methylase